MRDEFGAVARKPERDPSRYSADRQRHACTPLAQSRQSALVGQALRVSEWRPIDRPSINAFAGRTADRQSNAGIARLSADGPQESTFYCTSSNSGA
ncbi:hypothetical protein [Burkholderia aenigmatica]|uniref:hypothetical protein n=1 Tax=Burkholderia aenigmatica TaxID=2015348 RepID=UPI0026566184|nr:hypothetical protein [Burkholderia aenigmatica]MDN7875151.1 hypothetical protein [Burkholderia aenigmatica]